MHKPELMSDFNDLVHKTINQLEDKVSGLRSEVTALKERLDKLEGTRTESKDTPKGFTKHA